MEAELICGICRKPMTEETNCGGDCVFCMAEAGDPDCIVAVEALKNIYVYNDGQLKSRVREDGKTPNGEIWYIVESKSATDEKALWEPYLFGTAKWLKLTEEEKKWAIKKK